MARHLITYLVLSAGMFCCVNGFIDWAAVSAIGAVTSAITSGTSMAYSSLSAAAYNVVCTIEIENWTKYTLTFPASHLNGGQASSSPTPVLPGKREKFVVHKTGGSATGTSGTASWLIADGNMKRAVVMWSCPYSFDFHSNWLGIGITTSGSSGHSDWLGQMYHGGNGTGLRFVRGEYYYHTRSIYINDEKFQIVGTMGTSHRARARIIVRPLNEADLAYSLRALLEK